MRGLVSVGIVGLFALGCVVKSGEESGQAGQGGDGNAVQNGSAGSSPSSDGGAAGAPSYDCSLSADDDICSSCVKKTCCEAWWACLGDCADQIECYQLCLQDRGSIAADDDAACREECEVEEAKTQTALIECLVSKDEGCGEECF